MMETLLVFLGIICIFIAAFYFDKFFLKTLRIQIKANESINETIHFIKTMDRNVVLLASNCSVNGGIRTNLISYLPLPNFNKGFSFEFTPPADSKIGDIIIIEFRFTGAEEARIGEIEFNPKRIILQFEII